MRTKEIILIVVTSLLMYGDLCARPAPSGKLQYFYVGTYTKAESKGIYIYSIMKDARHWHGLMDVLIRRADEDDRMLNNNVPQELIQTSNHNSIADELIKLSDLKTQGILSDDEFNLQKQKLLSN